MNVRPPPWAIAQRELIAAQGRAAEQFLARYCRADGTYYFRRQWPGMDGSDDAYEGFQALPLLYALGGPDWLLPRTHHLWLGSTWQFTRYGQVHRNFDGYYDWMHHGESSLVLYHLGLADPGSLVQRDQAIRFAAMYNGEDPHAENWDAAHRMIRSPINGSRGPRFELTAEDWSTHRDVLSVFHPPFEDLPDQRLDAPCSWDDETMFAEILKRINERWTRGDVPLNLSATTFGAHAFLWTGEEKYRRWAIDYFEAWVERAARNGGICPDNVGPNDIIGELNDGRWWGGYYGWWWPHGPHIVLEAITVASMNAALLDGDLSRLDFARSQFDLVMEHARFDGDRLIMPNRYGAAGWDDYSRTYSKVIFDPRSAIALWEMSRDEGDADRVRKLIGHHFETEPTSDLQIGNMANWVPYFRYRTGENDQYPEQILSAGTASVRDRLGLIDADHDDVESLDMHHWLRFSPVVCEPLLQTSIGASAGIYHGGLLHAPIRHFDADNRRPGLPDSVAVLVTHLSTNRIEFEVVNLAADPRRLVVQAGGFGEHRFGDSRVDGPARMERTDSGRHLRLELPPDSRVTVEAPMRRYSATPSYQTPFVGAADYSDPIVPRDLFDE